MVLPLKPVRFYGSILPRPRIYTDVKLSDERVDPPISVLDPLMSWATDAHWSMGGLSFNHLRLQGKIEGNVKKLRKERETSLKMKIQNSSPVSQSKKKGESRVDLPLHASISKKRRQRSKMVDEEEEDDEIEIEKRKEKKNNGGLNKEKRRRLARKLGDEFEFVGSEERNGKSPLKDLSNGGGVHSVALRTRSRRSMVLMEEEEEGDADNGKAVNIEEKKVSVAPSIRVRKESEGKGSSPGSGSDSVSGFASGSRSSPRLKQRLG